LSEIHFIKSHICNLYRTPLEQQRVLSHFIRDGLTRHEKVIFIIDPQYDGPFLNSLITDDSDATPFISSGQVTFYATFETYLQDKHFDPDRMIAYLTRETDQALREDYTALRVTGDMSWARRYFTDYSLLVTYEDKVNRLLSTMKCTGLCQYDRWCFPPSFLSDVLHLHTSIIYRGFEYVNPTDDAITSFLADQN
jgi:hypothetical protein